jgi:putative tryptophan/tyrosine transport system substrate-binding protein
VRRRDFVAGLGIAVAWPPRAMAQQPAGAALPVVGWIINSNVDTTAALRRGLAETGYVEGRNLTIESRILQGRNDWLPMAVADLVSRKVAVIAVGGNAATIAAKAATATIPIVFSGGGDPVKLGLVASLNRPGGNLTGVTNFASQVETKRFALLCDLVPTDAPIIVLVSRYSPSGESVLEELKAAARLVRRQITILTVGSESEIDIAFANLVQPRASALFVTGDAFFIAKRDQLIALASRYAIPASYFFSEFVAAGGLMSYGASLLDGIRHVGVYVGRILNGEKPADLPVVQPTKFEFVINLKTAKAIDLTIPETLLATADEVIQ